MLACVPCTWKDFLIVPDAERRQCMLCQQPIWLGPASFEMAQTMTIVCIDCAIQHGANLLVLPPPDQNNVLKDMP